MARRRRKYTPPAKPFEAKKFFKYMIIFTVFFFAFFALFATGIMLFLDTIITNPVGKIDADFIRTFGYIILGFSSVVGLIFGAQAHDADEVHMFGIKI